MNLKNRINAINNKISVSPQDEAKQQELRKRIEEGRARCKAAGIKISDHHTKFTPGAGIGRMLQEAREARVAHVAQRGKGGAK